MTFLRTGTCVKSMQSQMPQEKELVALLGCRQILCSQMPRSYVEEHLK